MQLSLVFPLLCAGVLAILSGCGEKPAPSPPPAYKQTAQWSANGWTEPERTEFHHLAEGSELMPYVLLANLVSVKTGKPFLENLERFGFVPDAPSGVTPHGLPIGFTTVRSRNASHVGLEMVGFNCATCHTGKVSYHGKSLLVDGAPSMVDLQAYQIEFRDSFEATIRNPSKFAALVIAIDRQLHAGKSAAADAAAYASDAAVKSAGEVAAAPIADPNLHTVSSRAADAADPSAALGSGDFAARFRRDVAFLKAWLAYMRNGKLLLDGTEPGPGRIDAFGAARNLLFPKSAVLMQSPVSFPFIWDVPDNIGLRTTAETVWIHYDGNTNSILERNIGQALGMGALFDPKTYESTLRVGNLQRLEVLMHKLKAPGWPADLFGAIDPVKARAGEKVFNEVCRDCHQNRLYKLTEVGTDPQRANSFGQPVAGVAFPTAVAPILNGLKARAFLDDGIPPAQQAAMDANPVVWRATGEYLARPLAGVWATAPYLHNGSVPTLWHLLHPDQRPAKFVVGNREYDPGKVGFVTSGEGYLFDTSQPGNSNIGHAGAR